MALLQQNRPPLTSNPLSLRLYEGAQEVEAALEAILPPPTTRLHEAIRYSVLGGGKRLRAFLVRESCDLFGVPPQEALKVAAAVELIQAYSLVHDDLPCMDDADMRRGKPSCHKVFGEATATLVGDALIPLAFQTLAALDVPAAGRLGLIEHLSSTIGSYGLVAGQMIDLNQEGPCKTYEDLCELQRLKTGVFFAFACESGAILGNASLKERAALRSYGLLLGQAFQMIDDWLDGCGNEQTMGKPAGQDTSKVTFLSLLGPELLHQRAESVVQEAIDALSPLPEKNSLLKDVAEYVLMRRK